jgi:hypothetical protein
MRCIPTTTRFTEAWCVSSCNQGKQIVLTAACLPTLQSRIGPPKTMCYQTQRYAMYESNQLVFETSQVHGICLPCASNAELLCSHKFACVTMFAVTLGVMLWGMVN